MPYLILGLYLCFFWLLYWCTSKWKAYMETHYACQAQIHFNNIKLENLKNTQSKILHILERRKSHSGSFDIKRPTYNTQPSFDNLQCRSSKSRREHSLARKMLPESVSESQVQSHNITGINHSTESQ